jgi:hypothetical protein
MDSTTATFKDLEVKDICAGYYMAPSIYLRDGIKVDGAGESATLQITGGAIPSESDVYPHFHWLLSMRGFPAIRIDKSTVYDAIFVANRLLDGMGAYDNA